MVSTKRVCRSPQNIFFTNYWEEPFQHCKILQQRLFVPISEFWKIYTGCCPLLNVYFNNMQINRWRSFKVKDTFFTLGWLLQKFVEYLFLESFFVSYLILKINLFCSIADIWCRNFLKFWYWCSKKYFLFFIRF